MQKVRRHFKKLRQIVSIKFQSLFTFAKSFSLFPHGTFHYQSLKLLDFEGGPSIFKQNMTCSILLNIQNIRSLFYRAIPLKIGYLLWLLKY